MTPTQPPLAQPVPLRRRPLFTPYVVMWTIGGALSIAYLAVAIAAPELIEDLRPASAVIADPQSNQGQRAAARLASDIQGLRDSITQVQLDLSKIKTDVASHGAREKVLTSQLVELEKKLAAAEQRTIETSSPRAPAPQREAAGQMALPPEIEVPGLTLSQPRGAVESEAQAVVAPAQPKLINADAAAKPAAELAAAKTAAKTAAPADFTTAVIRPPARPVGVQISSGASLDSLRLSWSLLADRHADTLKNMQARYVANGDAANPNYDLIAGPIKSKAEAQKVCKTLSARNIPCKVGDFGGDAL